MTKLTSFQLGKQTHGALNLLFNSTKNDLSGPVTQKMVTMKIMKKKMEQPNLSLTFVSSFLQVLDNQIAFGVTLFFLFNTSAKDPEIKLKI